MPAYGTLLWVVVAVAAGAAWGTLARDRGRRPSTVRWWWAIVAGVGLRVLVELVDVPGGVILLMLSYGLLLMALWCNRAWTGTPVVALGLASCALVASLNGGTPVSADALEAVGRGGEAAAGGALAGERHVEVGRDRLAVLGDVVPVPLTRHVTSFGELVALVGLADLAFNATARRPGRRRPANPDGPDVPGVPGEGSDASNDGAATGRALASRR